MGKQNKDKRKDNPTYGRDKKSGGHADYQHARTTSSLDSASAVDYSVYENDQISLSASASFPWFKIIGNAVDYSDNMAANAGTSMPDIVPTSMANIMRIDFIPGPGIAKNGNDPVNRAFAQIMADLYAKTTGASLGFQQADLAMLQLSLSSLTCLMAVAKRALKAADFWISKNNMYPRALIDSMGLNWDEIIRFRPEYISELNSYIAMFNNIQTPEFLSVFKRHFALCNDIFVDEDSAFGQIYYFMPKGYYRYIDTEMKCEFKYLSLAGNATSFRGLLDIIRDCLQQWYQSSDLYNINGALLRCYGGAPLAKISSISMDDILSPTCDKHMLMEISNMDIVPFSYFEETQFDITQDPENNIIIWNPKTKHEAYPVPLSYNKFFRLFDDNPGEKENVVMTRLSVCGFDTRDEVGHYMEIVSCGTEIVVGVEIFALDADNTTSEWKLGLDSNFALSQVSSIDDLAKGVIALAPFRYVPFIPIIDVAGHVAPFGDIYNYTQVDGRAVGELHKVCLLSAWKVTWAK